MKLKNLLSMEITKNQKNQKDLVYQYQIHIIIQTPEHIFIEIQMKKEIKAKKKKNKICQYTENT